MKLIPPSSATFTVRIASVSVIGRNTPPSDDAPNPSADTFNPVLPSSRYSIESACVSDGIDSPHSMKQTTDMDPLRYIIVGTGGFGGYWCSHVLPRLATIGKAVATAAVDLNPEARAHAQKTLNLPPERTFAD